MNLNARINSVAKYENYVKFTTNSLIEYDY